jgi:hypothetical protein
MRVVNGTFSLLYYSLLIHRAPVVPCWAFAATGSLEASAAQRIAYSAAYQTSVRQQNF